MGRARIARRERPSRSLTPRLRRPAGAASFPFRLLAGLPARAASLLAPLALLLAALSFAAPAAAQTSVELVANDGKASDDGATFAQDRATSFTTGPSREGYTLTGVDLFMKVKTQAFAGSAIDYLVYIARDSGFGTPGDVLTNAAGNLVGMAGSAVNQDLTTSFARFRFRLESFSRQAHLEPNTTYWVVFDNSRASNTDEFVVDATRSHLVDTGQFQGWSIGNGRLNRSYTTTSGWSGATSHRHPLRMSVRGYPNDVTPPVAVGARLDTTGTKVTIDYDDALDPVSVPSAARFKVYVGGDRTPESVAVSGPTVTLTLDSDDAADSSGQRVVVSYDAASATGSPVRDASRNKAAGLSDLPVANDFDEDVPTNSTMSIVSTPSRDADSDNVPETYGEGAEIRVRLTYSEAVTVTTAGVLSRPRVRIKLHSGHGEKWADYASGSGTSALDFVYTVASGDTSKGGTPETDNGIAVLANSLELNGGTIRSVATGRAASLSFTGRSHDSDHKVDGSLDGKAPRFRVAHIEVIALQIYFDEELDSTATMPPASSFCVTATPPGGSARRICGSGTVTVSLVNERQLTVNDLSGRVFPGEVLTLAYTKPATNPLQDAHGNEVASFSGKPASLTDFNALTKPADVTATAVSGKGGSLSVNWTALTNAAGYDLRYYAGASVPAPGREADWVEQAPGLPVPAASDTSATIKGLNANTTYQVQVRGKYSSGEKGPWSATASGTTAAADGSNNAPRVLQRKPVDGSGNVCAVVSSHNYVRREATINGPSGTLVSLTGLVGDRTSTGNNTWPDSCTDATSPWVPYFDDVDGDELIITAERHALPDHIRAWPGGPFTIVQKGGELPPGTVHPTGRVWFHGEAAFRSPGARDVWAILKATDPHGASIYMRLIVVVTALGNEDGAPQLPAVDDVNASLGRAVSLALPAATGGDLGDLGFPYYYRVTGLPDGLVFDPETRTVSGIPGETGTFEVTYTADDADRVGSAHLDPDCPNGDTVDGVECGNDTASVTFTIRVRPFIELVRLVSEPTHDANGDGRNDTYVRGDRIVVDVEFTEPVALGGGAVRDATTGTYEQVKLRLFVKANDAALDRTRHLKVIDLVDIFHGGRTLRFVHQVARADHDPDGVHVGLSGESMVILRDSVTLKGLVSGLDADRTKTRFVTGGAVGTDGIPRSFVNGRADADAGPKPAGAAVNGETLTVTFDEGLAALDDDDVAALAFQVGVQGAGGTNGNRNAYQHPTGFAVTGSKLTMTLGVPARPGDRVTVGYTLFDNEGPLKDAGGRMAPAFTNLAAANVTRGETSVATQTGVTLVGNDGQSSADTEAGTFERDYATSFTTGSGSGYVLKRVDVWMKRKSGTTNRGGQTQVDIYTDASGVPDTWVGRGLVAASDEATESWAGYQHTIRSGVSRTSPLGIDLDPDTTYWAVVHGGTSQDRDLQNYLVGGTSSDAEDSGGQSGWSIGNDRLSTTTRTSWSASNTNTNAVRMKLVGDVYAQESRPQPLGARVAGTELKIVFDRALDAASSVSGRHFVVRTRDLDDNSKDIAGTAANADVAGSTVTVTLAEAVMPDVLASVTYDPPALDLKASDDTPVPRFAGFRVETVLDTVAPALTQAGVAQTHANPARFRVALYYDEALNPDSVPAADDFSVTLDTRDAVTPSAVALEGGAVVLTVDLAAAPDDEEVDGTYEKADVAYTKGDEPDPGRRGQRGGGVRQPGGHRCRREGCGRESVRRGGAARRWRSRGFPSAEGTLVSNTGQWTNSNSDTELHSSTTYYQTFTHRQQFERQGYKLIRVDLEVKYTGSATGVRPHTR